MDIVNLLMVAILIVMTAFFVATEFAIVKVRTTRIDHLIKEGNKNAVHARKLIDNMDAYLSACQLGITVTALGIGWLGEPAVASLLSPIIEGMEINTTVSHVVSVAMAFVVITFLHVVLGELAPKTIAIQKAETITLWLSRPLMLFHKVMFPFIWLLNGSSRLLIRLFGFKPMNDSETAHSEEEVRLILSNSYESGEINQSEMRYVNNIFEFDDRLAKEIMTPRTEMICFFKEDSFRVNIDVIREGQYTRYPVADDDKDHIIGLVNLKEIFMGHIDDEQESIERYIRPIIHVSESTPIKQVLIKMQMERIHMAVVIDEYGGTAGLLTVEDILEEIVGDIRDEFDNDEMPMVEKVNDTTTIVDGKMLLDDINALLGTNLEEEEVDTIGGWVINKNMDAKKGTTIEDQGYNYIVEEIDGYQIKKVKIVKS